MVPETVQLKSMSLLPGWAERQTVAPPPVPQLPLVPPLEEDDVEDVELVVELDVELVVELLEEPSEGIEHSLVDLAGFGSLPKVATLQVNDPLKTLYTKRPDAPKATLVGELTEQV